MTMAVFVAVVACHSVERKGENPEGDTESEGDSEFEDNLNQSDVKNINISFEDNKFNQILNPLNKKDNLNEIPYALILNENGDDDNDTIKSISWPIFFIGILIYSGKL